jgi:hypothetical protein
MLQQLARARFQIWARQSCGPPRDRAIFVEVAHLVHFSKKKRALPVRWGGGADGARLGDGVGAARAKGAAEPGRRSGWPSRPRRGPGGASGGAAARERRGEVPALFERAALREMRVFDSRRARQA